MREETANTSSVFDELSNAAGDAQSESYESALGSLEGQTNTTETVEQELEGLMEQVNGTLSTEDVQFDEAMVKENLDEILLLLIAFRGEAHGKELLSDLSQLFDATLSPGTVYPALHALNEDDVLALHTKVRTKEYSINDGAHVRNTVEQTMVQHLAFGLLLYAFLGRL
ncbi:PadR family transcriptional regulator [Natronolimnobius baerhuensis]|uniref:PadR family transcriptional regulator n=1 Tax=Natronolimnobius baerhuensis TaxID=253108 RepID=A0A202E9U3_9EURY|nr:helix-turn-helix transcriptional regulator [Natronolimnobius baerhuensis]OVE85012.1 PadR family transcriptional regulator [Natronolimnobius baerhuensis]